MKLGESDGPKEDPREKLRRLREEMAAQAKARAQAAKPEAEPKVSDHFQTSTDEKKRDESRVSNPPLEEGGGDKRNKQRYELWSSSKFTSLGFILIPRTSKIKG